MSMILSLVFRISVFILFIVEFEIAKRKKNETLNKPNSSSKILSMNSEITMQVGNHSFIRHAVI